MESIYMVHSYIFEERLIFWNLIKEMKLFFQLREDTPVMLVNV